MSETPTAAAPDAPVPEAGGAQRRHEDRSRADWFGLGALILAAAILSAVAAVFFSSWLAADPGTDAARRIVALETRLGQIAAGNAGAAAQGAYSDLTARLEGVEVRVRALEGTAAAPQAGGGVSAARITAMEQELAALRARTDALEQRPAPAPSMPQAPAPDLQALSGLSAEIARLSAAMAGVDQRLTTLEARTPSAAFLEGIEARLAAIEKDDPARAARTAALAMLVARLKDASATGAPFALELTALRNLDLPQFDLSALEPFAAAGAPTIAALIEKGRAAWPEWRDAAAQDAGGDTGSRFLQGLLDLVDYRSAEPPQGNDPPAIIQRLRLALEAGDIGKAWSEAGQLTGAAAQAVASWRAEASARFALDRLTRDLSTAVFAELSRPVP